MITWKQQGAAAIGALVLVDGRGASVALVGPRQNTKGAALIMKASEGDEFDTITLKDAVALLSPEQVVDIICSQERIYGSSGLTTPEGIS